MKRPNARIAVTGFGGLDDPDSGSAVARCLRQGWEGQIAIEAFGYDSIMTAAWMPGVADQLHVIPRPTTGDQSILDSILAIHEKLKLDALIPCVDMDVPVFSRIASRLADAGIQTLLPRPDRVAALNRTQLPKFYYDNQIAALRSIHVPNVSDVPVYADQLGYPLYVEGTVAGATVVYSAQQALIAAKALDGKWGNGVVLQQTIAGEEYAVAMVAGADGSCRGLVAMRKLAINQAGQEVCGAVVEDPRIWKFARDILERLDWRGPLLLDLVRLPGETQPYLRDIDYRFPPWIVLTHWAKCNLPVILLEEILGGRSSFTESGHAGTLIMRSISETAVPFGDLIRLQRKGSVEGPMKNGGSPHPKFRNDIERIAIKVAITGTSTFDMINPGLGVARALRQAHGISRVYGLNYGTFESGSYQADLFDASFRLPITGDAEILLQRLQEIHQNHPFDVLLPCLDGELPQFISLREEIEALGVRTILPPQSAFDKRSKLHLFGTGIPRDWIGFEIPESYIAFTEEEVVNSVNSVGLPAVVKGPLWGCIQVDSLLEARVAWNRLLTEGVDQAVVQPMIAGAMFAVAVVCNRDSEVLTTLTVKKLARCGRGSTWSALQVQQPQLEASFAKFLQEIGWVGPAEGEFIRDDIRDRFYLLEVNPRFTGWISYSGALGSNHPYIAVRAALGDELDLRTDPADLVFMRSSNEITVQSTDLASLSLKGFINNVKR